MDFYFNSVFKSLSFLFTVRHSGFEFIPSCAAIVQQNKDNLGENRNYRGSLNNKKSNLLPSTAYF